MVNDKKFRFLYKDLLGCIALFGVIALLLNSGRLIESISPSLITFKEIESNSQMTWVGNKLLQPNEYYISMGRPQGSCELLLNGKKIDSNEGGDTSERSALYIGARFKVEFASEQLVQLSCHKLIGSQIRLIHSPYVSFYKTGISLQLLRILTDSFVPLFAVVLALLTIIYISLSKSKLMINYAIILAGLFTPLYLISLTNITRLLLTNKQAFLLHTLMKVGFSFSVLNWLHIGYSNRRLSASLSILSALSLILFYFEDYAHFAMVYNIFYHSLPIIGATCLYLSVSISKNKFTRFNTLSPAVAFIIFTVLDCITFDIGRGAFMSNITVISLFLITVAAHIKIEKAKTLANKVISVIASKQLEKSSTTESLGQIAMILSECLKLRDWSIYIDSFNLGSSPRQGRELRRVASSNAGNKTTNAVISFEDDEVHGQTMKKAFESKHPIVSESENGSIYTVIPIGDACCININDTRRSKLGEEFIKTFHEESYQQINSLALTIIKFESTASFSITLLKEELGIGTHELEFGAIFADAIGYTQNVKLSKSFIEFFEREYIPSLLRNLDKKVILKDLFGDELYLVVLPKKLTAHNDKNIYTTTMNIVQLIQEFSLGNGAELCTTAGYKPIEFRIGANAGPGQIVVSHSNVALSGPVIEAKRCQGRAHASEPFVTDILLENAPESLRRLSVKETYAAKKEILSGFRISFKNKAA